MGRDQALRELIVKWRRLAEPYIATQTSEQHPIRCDLQVCADELEAALAEPQAGTLYTEGDTPRVHQKSIVEEAKEEMLRAASGEPTREVLLCSHCGKPESDSKHVRYGNDVDNPVKHIFVVQPPATLSEEQVMQAINRWRSTYGSLAQATDYLNALLRSGGKP